MSELPDEMETWKLRTEWLRKGYDSNSKRAVRTFDELMSFCNGDSTSTTMTHWCLPGCCDSDESALQKVMKLLVPLICRGYPCPLLYRFKHYKVASSYMKSFCCLNSVLPRSLTQMKENSDKRQDAANRLGDMVDSLLQETGWVFFEDQGQEECQSFQAKLGELLDNDLSYSLQNGVRKRLVTDEISKPEFSQSAILIDTIVDAMEVGTNLFLQRTTWLTKLSAFGSGHPEYPELVKRSTFSFVQIVSGALGRKLICKTMDLLDSGLQEASHMGLDTNPHSLLLFFKLIIAAVTDLWRRMDFDLSVYPFRVFTWLEHGQKLEDFVGLWDTMIMDRRRCSNCMDATFTSVLADTYPMTLKDEPRNVQRAIQKDILDLLGHIAAFTPVNSDCVEIKNGQLQWAVAKRGGQFVKAGKSAAEVSLLQSAVRPHGVLHGDVYDRTMPSRLTSSAIRRQVGVASKNQHTIATSDEKVAGVKRYLLVILTLILIYIFRTK